MMHSFQNLRPRLTAQLARDGYDFLQPRIHVQFGSTSIEWATAATQLLAAKIELATPSEDTWTVELLSIEESQSVIVLNLAGNDLAEAERAMALLEALLEQSARHPMFDGLRLPKPAAPRTRARKAAATAI